MLDKSKSYSLDDGFGIIVDFPSCATVKFSDRDSIDPKVDVLKGDGFNSEINGRVEFVPGIGDEVIKVVVGVTTGEFTSDDVETSVGTEDATALTVLLTDPSLDKASDDECNIFSGFKTENWE